MRCKLFKLLADRLDFGQVHFYPDRRKKVVSRQRFTFLMGTRKLS